MTVAVGLVPAGHGAGHGVGGQIAAGRNGFQSPGSIEIDGGFGPCASAGVEASEFAGLGVVDEPEVVAAGCAHLRIDHRQGDGRGYGGVHGVASAAQNVESGLRGQMVGRGHHAVRGQRVGALGNGGTVGRAFHGCGSVAGGAEYGAERRGSEDGRPPEEKVHACS